MAAWREGVARAVGPARAVCALRSPADGRSTPQQQEPGVPEQLGCMQGACPVQGPRPAAPGRYVCGARAERSRARTRQRDSGASPSALMPPAAVAGRDSGIPISSSPAMAPTRCRSHARGGRSDVLMKSVCAAQRLGELTKTIHTRSLTAGRMFDLGSTNADVYCGPGQAQLQSKALNSLTTPRSSKSSRIG